MVNAFNMLQYESILKKTETYEEVKYLKCMRCKLADNWDGK